MVKKTSKKPTSKSREKVSFEPNKMTFAISALAVVSLFLFAFIASQS